MKGGILRKTIRKITLFVMLNSFSFAGETPHHSDIISASIDTASVYVKHLQFDQALSLYEKTLKQLMFNENNNFELIADVYRKIGRTHRKLKNDKLFLEYMFLSSDILKNHLGENHQKVAESYNNIGAGYNEIGEHEKALDYFEKTLIIESKMDTPKVNICLNNIGTTYIKIGKYEEALMYLKKALKGNVNEFGNVNVHVSTVLYNIAATYSYMKKYEETLDYYQKSLTMDKMIFGENHYYLAGTYAELGNVFFRMKDYSMALEKYIKSLEIFTSVYGNYHRSVGNSFRNIAITHQRIGNIDKSLTMIQKALFSFAGEKENSNALINPLQSKRTEHSDNLRALVNKGSILLNMGRKKQSVDTLSTAFNTLKIASNLMETLLKERQTETSKIILLKDHKSLYSKAVETAVILGELTEDTTYYESAFLFSERAKAAVISERLQESEAFFYSGIPDSAMSRKRSNEVYNALIPEFPTVEFIDMPYAPTGETSPDGFPSCKGIYVNALQTTDNIYVPIYNLPEDAEALTIFETHTNKTIIPVNADEISLWGGSVHCLSWEILRAPANLLGDINLDGDINILDVTLVINHILGSEPEIENGDINGDEIINILDVVTFSGFNYR